jgi:hypothetical protein
MRVGAFALPGATLPDYSGRKPSGIPVARLAGEPGAVVSSGVPPRTSLGGAPLLERSQRQSHAKPVGDPRDSLMSPIFYEARWNVGTNVGRGTPQTERRCQLTTDRHVGIMKSNIPV